MKTKKGQAIATLTAIVGPIIAIAIVLAVGFLIIAEMKEQVVNMQSGTWCEETDYTTFNTTDSLCYNATSGDDGRPAALSYGFNGTAVTQDAMDDIPGWLPIIIVAIIGAALLSLVALFRTR